MTLWIVLSLAASVVFAFGFVVGRAFRAEEIRQLQERLRELHLRIERGRF